MRQITIIVNSELISGMNVHASECMRIRFVTWDGVSDISPTDDIQWAFINGTVSLTDGLEMCRRLRCMPQTAHAQIFLTVDQNDEEVRQKAKRAGANHCLSGPVSQSQILKMVTSFEWQDDHDSNSGIFKCGELEVDSPAFQARWMGKPIPMMPNEFQLLKFFVEHSGRVYTRGQITTLLGKQREWVDERTVDAWVGRLRRNLKAAGAPEMLRTVRSFGFILDRP